MGGCYSSDSESGVTCPTPKPGDKPGRHTRKGPQYSPLINGNAQQQEDTEPERISALMPPDAVAPATDSKLSPCAEGERRVAPSDSGIESLGPALEESSSQPEEKEAISLCKSCHDKLKRISQVSCQQCGRFQLFAPELSYLMNGNTNCTCGPRQHGRITNCQTRGLRGNICTSHRHSDIPAVVLKSNLKKQRQSRGEGKRVRMSWKSTDSLDINSSMVSCMDRAKSEASDVFADDVSFRAPLAHFDSVDTQLYSETCESMNDDTILASRMSIYSEILDLADSICQRESIDAPVNSHSFRAQSCPSQPWSIPGSEYRQLSPVAWSASARLPAAKGQQCLRTMEEEDEDHGHGLSKSENCTESTPDSEMEAWLKEDVAERNTFSCPSSLRNADAGILGSFPNDHEDVLCPTSVMVKGHQMVMMDARIYRQMLTDLTQLREQLSHLTQVIQEEQDAAG